MDTQSVDDDDTDALLTRICNTPDDELPELDDEASWKSEAWVAFRDNTDIPVTRFIQ